MKVSAHRYRQSRHGATLASSKWFMPVLFGAILSIGLLGSIAIAFALQGI